MSSLTMTPILLLSLPVVLSAFQRGSVEKAGLRLEKLEAARQLLRKEVESGSVGAAAWLVARNGVIVIEEGLGRLSRAKDAAVCQADSVFLVASITKPVTAIALMRLVQQERVRLEDPVQKYLPEFKGGQRDQVTIRQLLSHTSGLPDMLPENIELRRRHAPLREFVLTSLRTPLLFTPGSKVSYQSMGILLASEIVERLTGRPFREYVRDEVLIPLKMSGSSLGLGGRSIDQTVICDVPQQGELKMSDQDRSWDWNSRYWRDLGAPWGGLHSTVGDIGRLLQATLDGGSPVLKRPLTEEMLRNQNSGLEKAWGLGWSLGPDRFVEGSTPATFGHNGATGTLCWADPSRNLIFVAFTNRAEANDKTQLLRRLSKLVSDAADLP
ncbi:MAG: serine hydrolase domain-containing protein [Acidobacteriota bacterium]